MRLSVHFAEKLTCYPTVMTEICRTLYTRQNGKPNFCPPLYSPTHTLVFVHSENATHFLREIGYYCDFTETDIQGKCRLLPLLLRDRASLWYDSLPAGISNNWVRLSGAFRARFGPTAMNLVQEMTLLDRKQSENESVDNYTVDMVRRLDMTSLPPEEKVKVYVHSDPGDRQK